jgi:hypothetical protein
MGNYSIVGGGGLLTTPHSLNTSSQDTQHSCKETSPPLLHTTHNNTTTLYNSTRVHKTTNVPVVFMALHLMVLRATTSLLGWVLKISTFLVQMTLSSLVPFQGPKKSRFSGPTPSNAPSSDVARVPRHKNNRVH